MLTLNHTVPLATRMRPENLEEFVGQNHLLGKQSPLRHALETGLLHSMIFWGPPGTGKTTLARLITTQADAAFRPLSAISTGVKEIRQLVVEAQQLQQNTNRAMVLFIDEIHRFNKAQQDVFLPYIENGTFIVIGATTENPSFELNNALLSRMRVYVLKRLSEDALLQVLDNALRDAHRGLGHLTIEISLELRTLLARAADGDSRQVLNLLEIIGDLAASSESPFLVTKALLTEVLQTNLRRFDKQGDAFYDQISALHKAVRGSAPDAALYWFCRMLDGGCDPLYIARRLLRMASEDIGLADPRALEIALSAYDTFERLGSPEGELALAQAVIYLSCAAKSNAAYKAFKEAMNAAQNYGSLPVPLHLCNAPTPLLKKLGHSKNYRYAHNEPDAYAAGETYFPEGMQKQTYYHPVSRGLEEKIAARLAYFAKLDDSA